MKNRRRMSLRQLPGIELMLVCAALLASSCSTSAPKRTALMRQAPNVTVTASELRVRVRALAPRLSGVIEDAADRVLDETTEPDHRMLAQEWRVTTIPALQAALFQPDPLAALIDAATFGVQMRIFFEEGPGADIPERPREIALEASRHIEEELFRLAVAISSQEPADRTRGRIEQWAREHPISSFPTRQSPVGELASFTSGGGVSGLQAVGSLGETMDDIVARVDLYNQFIPKQARWQAELLLLESLYYSELRATFDDIASIPLNIRSVEDKITAEREIVFAKIDSEMASVLPWIRGERLDTQSFVTAERLAVLDAVAAERAIVLAAVQAERVAVLEAVHRERVEALADVERMMGEVLTEPAERLIDHAFLRAVQLGAALVLSLAVLGFSLAWFVTRRLGRNVER